MVFIKTCWFRLVRVRDITLEYIKFITEKRGPYSKDIQNTVDHLVATGLVSIQSFERVKGGSLANYKITEAGQEAIKLLRLYNVEDEKHWWISLITNMAFTYYFVDELKGTNDDKIKTLVYQDPTYKKLKRSGYFHSLIELDDPENLTYQLIQFIKTHAENNVTSTRDANPRRVAEIIILTFFEYLYVSYLKEQK